MGRSTWPTWLTEILSAAEKDEDRDRATFTVNSAFTRWREELKAAGMCTQGCGKPHYEKSSLFCEEHHMKALFRGDRRRQRNIANGMCTTCGTRPHDEGRRVCTPCAERSNARCKKRYETLRENKVCSQCRAAVSGRFAMCSGCRAKSRVATTERQHDLRDRGMCVACGKVETGGTRYCRACNDRFNEQRRAARKRDREEELRAAMKLVLERESEYFETGVKIVDAEYLEAKEIVMKKAV